MHRLHVHKHMFFLGDIRRRRKIRKMRTSYDPVRALPAQRGYGLLWFYLCGIPWTNGDRSRQREDS